VEFASSAQAQAEQATEEARAQLAAAEEELKAARGELDAKDARLLHLEGRCGEGCGAATYVIPTARD
jgi:hypothetical protein